MNYMIIRQGTDDPMRPPEVVQIFTDDDLHALARFMTEMLENHGDWDSAEGVAAARVRHLLQQWEDKTQ